MPKMDKLMRKRDLPMLSSLRAVMPSSIIRVRGDVTEKSMARKKRWGGKEEVNKRVDGKSEPL
jgi:hypothetical protein